MYCTESTHSLFSPIHSWLPDQGVITELDLVGEYEVPTVRKDRHNYLAMSIRHLQYIQFIAMTTPLHNGGLVNMCRDLHWPPDWAASLQDDPGETRGSPGIHLQPLFLILILGAPRPVIDVPVLDTRLPRQIDFIYKVHFTNLNTSCRGVWIENGKNGSNICCVC
jgi:hypothetical protein